MAFHVHQRGVICPLCNAEVKPEGSRYQSAVMFAGNVLDAQQYEGLEDRLPDPDAEIDAYFDGEEFEAGTMEIIQRKMIEASHGDLAPVGAPQDAHSQKVLEDLSKKIHEGVANGGI